MGKSVEEKLEHFKTCPSPLCHALSHPDAEKCFGCRVNLGKRGQIHVSKLNGWETLYHQSFLHGLSAEEFVDGLKRVKSNQALSVRQQAQKIPLLRYLRKFSFLNDG